MGAGGLNCRVRDGTGWTPAAHITNYTLGLIKVQEPCVSAEFHFASGTVHFELHPTNQRRRTGTLKTVYDEGPAP